MWWQSAWATWLCSTPARRCPCCSNKVRCAGKIAAVTTTHQPNAAAWYGLVTHCCALAVHVWQPYTQTPYHIFLPAQSLHCLPLGCGPRLSTKQMKLLGCWPSKLQIEVSLLCCMKASADGLQQSAARGSLSAGSMQLSLLHCCCKEDTGLSSLQARHGKSGLVRTCCPVCGITVSTCCTCTHFTIRTHPTVHPCQIVLCYMHNPYALHVMPSAGFQ